MALCVCAARQDQVLAQVRARKKPSWNKSGGLGRTGQHRQPAGGTAGRQAARQLVQTARQRGGLEVKFQERRPGTHRELSGCEGCVFVNSAGVPAGGPQKIFRVFAPPKIEPVLQTASWRFSQPRLCPPGTTANSPPPRRWPLPEALEIFGRMPLGELVM